MAFSKSGSTITQTGTDANLSGLSALSGITSHVSGSKTTYVLSNVKINIQGQLTLDPRIEALLVLNFPSMSRTEGVLTVKSGGVLNLGKDISTGAITKYTQGEVFSMGVGPSSGPAACCGNFNFLWGDAGSQINWLGVTLSSGSYMRTNGNLKIRDGKWRVPNKVGRQFRFDPANSIVDIDGFEVENANIIVLSAFGSNDTFNGYVPIESAVTMDSDREDLPQNQKSVLVLENIDDTKNSPEVVSFWRDCAGYILKNSVNGGSTKIRTSSYVNGSDYGMVEFIKDIQVIYVDDSTSAAAIAGVVAYVPSYTITPAISTSDNSFHGRNWASRSYSQTSGANGTATLQNILYKIGQATKAAGTVSSHYLSKSANDTGTIEVRGASYQHKIDVFETDTKGAGTKEIRRALRVDTEVTEKNKATVLAYTQIETPSKLYDRAKAWLVDNYTGQTTPLLTRAGDAINAGAYNITLDKTATPVFAFDGTTLTIKTDKFSGGLITTGVITLANGATTNGVIIDANQNSALSFTGIDSWIVYAASTDRNTEQNPLGSGTAQAKYAFNYVQGTTYYLSLKIAGEIIRKDIIPAKSGETKVSLEMAGQLAAIIAQINAGVRTDETALHAALDSYAKKADWKADTTPLATEKTASAARDHARAANLQTQTA